MRYRCIAVLVLILAVVFLLGPGTALGQPTPTSTPTPSVSVAPTSVPLTVKKNGLFNTRSTKGQAIGTLLVVWPGIGQASVVTSGYYSDGASAAVNYHPGRAVTPFPTPSSTPVSVASDSPQPIAVCVNWAGSDASSGWLVVTDQAHPGPPATVPFQIKEFVPGGVLGGVLGWSALIAAVLVVAVGLTLWSRHPPLILAPGPTWTFSQSWASNLTALGAILGTVLAASGFASDVLPGLSVGMFLGFTFFYGALVLVAPVIFQMCSPSGKSTYPGLLVAGGIVIWALIGELWTAVVLLWRGGMPFWVGLVVLPAGIVALFFYTRASIVPVIFPPKKVDAAVTAASTAAAMAAAAAVTGGKSDDDAKRDALVAAKTIIREVRWGAVALAAQVPTPKTEQMDKVWNAASDAAIATVNTATPDGELTDAAKAAALTAAKMAIAAAVPPTRAEARLAKKVVRVVVPKVEKALAASVKAAQAAVAAKGKSHPEVKTAAQSAASDVIGVAFPGPTAAYML